MTPVYGELDERGEYIVVNVQAETDWQLKDVADRLHTLTPAFETTDEGPVLIKLSWAAVTQLAHTFVPSSLGEFGFTWTPGPRLCNWIIEEVKRRACISEVSGEPPKMDPMPHQYSGALAIGMNGRFLLGDEMRTGKTLTSLMGLAELAVRHRNPWPALVVCPASVVDTWIEELEKAYPSWRARTYRGAKRRQILGSADLYVTSYDTMRNDVGTTEKPGPLLKAGFRAIVFDECHKLCNYDSRQSVSARRLASHIPSVIAASGTPITNKVSGFWPVLNAMYPESYPSRDRYRDRYCLQKANEQYSDGDAGGLDPVREPEFRIVMQGTMRRVATVDVLKDLPPKTYETRWLDLPAVYRKAYDEMEADMIAHLPDSESPLEAMHTLAKMLRLSQLAHSACDVQVIPTNEWDDETGTWKEEVRVSMKEPSWKVDGLMEILEELKQDGEHRPALVFAPFRQLIMLAGARAEKEGYRTAYIVGGISQAMRTEARMNFQSGKLDVLCVTTSAGGTGLTLNRAHTEVFLARPWGAAESSQAEARGYGKGTLHVIDLVARNTIESRIRSALRDKARNLSELVRDPRIVRELFGGTGKEKEK